MNENRDNRRLPGLIWLLIYQWILVLVILYFIVTFGMLFITHGDYAFVLYILVLSCWGTALIFASVGMVIRSPRGFLVGMICHLLLEIPGLFAVLGFGFMIILSSLSADPEERGLASMFLLFALMWLPFVLISGWGFLYLRRLRKSLLTE
jgi:hypothetical protein